MTDAETRDVLRDIHMLEGVSDEHLELLAAIARCVDVPQGKTIFREGEPAHTVYLVASGNVSLEICAPSVGCKRILTVGAGELLGWSPVLEHERFTATARTLAPTRIVELEGEKLRDLCDEHPRLGYEFMRRAALALGKRLGATRLQLLNLYGSEMPESPSDTERGASS